MRLLLLALPVLFLSGCAGFDMQRAETAANTPSPELGGKTPLEVLGVTALELSSAIPGLVAAIQEGNVPVALQVGGGIYAQGTQAFTAVMIVIHAALNTPPPAEAPDQKAALPGRTRIQWRYK